MTYTANTTVPRWYARLTFVCMVTLIAIIGWVAYSQASGTVARYHRTSGPNAAPTRIVLRCSGYAEDSLAHLRMVAYDGERLVLRCRTSGY